MINSGDINTDVITMFFCLIISVFMFLESCSHHFLISAPVRAFRRVGEFTFALQ